MMRLPTPSLARNRRAFTLIETIIALGIGVSALLAALALFGLGLRNARDTADADELVLLSKTAEEWFMEVPFATLYGMVAANGPAPAVPGSGGTAPAPADPLPTASGLIVYAYRGDPTAALRTDGSLPPQSAGGRAGIDYELVTVARDLSIASDAAFADADSPSIEGIIAKYVPQLSEANPVAGLAGIAEPDYLEAVLAFRTRVYRIENPAAILGGGGTATGDSFVEKLELNFARLR